MPVFISVLVLSTYFVMNLKEPLVAWNGSSALKDWVFVSRGTMLQIVLLLHEVCIGVKSLRGLLEGRGWRKGLLLLLGERVMWRGVWKGWLRLLGCQLIIGWQILLGLWLWCTPNLLLLLLYNWLSLWRCKKSTSWLSNLLLWLENLRCLLLDMLIILLLLLLH